MQDILENFEFRNQIPRLSKADALGTLIEKFTSPDIDLSPAGLDNHGMGTVFEELVRRFNEENNEEAGEHWTPRDAVKLMAKLIFLPIANEIESGTYLLYDGALGTGGMLTVAEATLRELAAQHGKQVATHLYGQEINAETYAICKADLLLKGEGDAADNIVGGPEHSTLANDAFPSREFDFMLSNPPYGKSWKSDLERMGGKDGLKDPRFVITHAGDSEYSLITRSSDGQMLFLANLLSKMKHQTKLGSRIAEVHNGSSLFTGDAGQGESNIRRWIIENDWLEAIIALPENMFYNTGIATYIWVLTNRKPAHRQGRVQLIDATQWFKPLRKNLGKKNCELSEEDIARICDTFLKFEETAQSKIFPNAAFGYWKVTVERPLRLRGIEPERAYKPAEIKQLRETHERVDDAPPVIRKIHKKGAPADPLRGLFEAKIAGMPAVVEYESDPELRDTEQVPLLEDGGIEAFIRREVLPHAPDAWCAPDSVKTGYESASPATSTSRSRCALAEIRADIPRWRGTEDSWPRSSGKLMTCPADSSLRERLDSLASFLPAFEAPDFKFAHWAEPEEAEPGVVALPESVLSMAAMEFIDAAYAMDWVLRNFDWSEWMQTPEAIALRDDPGALKRATPDQLAKLLTVLIRQDRFVEGALAGAYDSGLVTAILRRAASLRDEIAKGDKA